MPAVSRSFEPHIFTSRVRTPYRIKPEFGAEDGVECWTKSKPKILLGDKAYDSDRLDAELADRGIEMISPNKKNRITPTQDGRKLRRYKRRWMVERAFAWLNSYRRTVTRWDMYSFNFRGFVETACMVILVKSFLR